MDRTFEQPLRLVIVGAVSGGILAATRARRLAETASIVVLESGQFVSYENPGGPYALGGIVETDTPLVLQTPAGLKTRYHLDVRTNSEVLSISPSQHTVEVLQKTTGRSYRLTYDKLILSQGAEPDLPPVAGINSPYVFTLRSAADLRHVREYIESNGCRNAVIIGGGFIGLRAAENLYNLGLHVSIIEADDHVLPPFDRDIAGLLHAELKRHRVTLHLNTTIAEIQEVESASQIVLASGQSVPTDLVIAATGIRPRISVAEEAGLTVGQHGISVNVFMQTSDPDIYAMGDNVETEHRVAHSPQRLALGGPAMRQARVAVDHIFGRATPYRGNVGTFVLKAFNLTAGITGLSIKQLREFGYSPLWATIHVPEHAGYYPAASQMTLRIAFERFTGRLLGAQAAGRFAVDKRIDVLSTALQAGMSVFDLQHLELAFAPQYGSARDAVNIAGNVGANILCTDVEVIHPEELQAQLEQWQVVDVRPAAEYAHGHVSTARSAPLDSLRESISSLATGKPTVVYSRVGYHGYIAYRILRQAGLTVANLDGGFKSLVDGGFQSMLTLSASLHSPSP